MSKKNNNLFSWLNNLREKSLSIKNNFFKKSLKKKKNISDNIEKEKSIGFLDKIFLGIKNKKDSFAFKIKNFFKKQEINDCFFEKLEEELLMFDFGITITNKIIKKLFIGYQKKQLLNKKDIYLKLQEILFNIVNIKNLDLYSSYNKIKDAPNIILIIGVNGVGKTTTIAKLGYLYKKLGYSIMLSASDTFRAAAIEQLKIWGERIDIPVFYKSSGVDPSSVIFDSIQEAKKKNIDILIVDTSGRLHNKIYLIEELKKNIRVIKKNIIHAPQEIFLVLDACNGQNSMNQTEIFYKELHTITGIVLTKLDSTFKGGIIFSILDKFRIPIKYISTGEKIKDFHNFHSKNFIKTFFNKF